MSAPDMAAARALQAIDSIPRDESAPVFPAPWAARAFAMAIELNDKGLLPWSDFAVALGEQRAGDKEHADGEAYWRSWLAALESVSAARRLCVDGELLRLQNAWRRAAEATPHGQPVRLEP